MPKPRAALEEVCGRESVHEGVHVVVHVLMHVLLQAGGAGAEAEREVLGVHRSQVQLLAASGEQMRQVKTGHDSTLSRITARRRVPMQGSS